MLTDALCAGPRAGARLALVQRQLGRYAGCRRATVRRLAARHPYLADLAVSFPALLFALAVPRRGFAPEPVIAEATAGAPLARLSELAQVPAWLRKLPPEAFVRALPDLPDGNVWRRRIANHLPRSPRLAPAWLQAVADAAEAGGEPFALWVAREMARNPKAVPPGCLRGVGLWAWFSRQPGTRAHALILRRWSPRLSFAAALSAASRWHVQVALRLQLGDRPLGDTWLRPCRVAGYDFVPLATADDVAGEAAAMKNCVAEYGRTLAHDRSRVWSMRRDGVRVATLQVARTGRDPLPNIVQLEAAGNRRAGVEVWWAARQWLNAHDLPRLETDARSWDTVPLDRETWVALWRPWWLALRRIPEWLPLRPSRRVFVALLGRADPGRILWF